MTVSAPRNYFIFSGNFRIRRITIALNFAVKNIHCETLQVFSLTGTASIVKILESLNIGLISELI